MREILFRGKAINRAEGREYRSNYKNGDWVYGLVTKMFDERYKELPAEMTNTNGIGGIEVDYRTVGQYTGLTDKNGSKIFEGDISKGKTVNGKQINYVFWFDETERAFVYGSSYKGGYRLSLSAYQLSSNEFEVIGNIHDNPELLEQEG